jgi:hypothetical protein
LAPATTIIRSPCPRAERCAGHFVTAELLDPERVDDGREQAVQHRIIAAAVGNAGELLVERQMGKSVRRRPDADQHGLALRVEFGTVRLPANGQYGLFQRIPRPPGRLLQRGLAPHKEVVAKHQVEAAREIHGKSNIGDALCLEAVGGRPCFAGERQAIGELLIPECGDFRQQARRAAEVMGGGRRRDTGAARRFAQGKPLQAAFGQKRIGSPDQRVTQVAVVIAAFGGLFLVHRRSHTIVIFTV